MLGLVDYDEALELQSRLQSERIEGLVGDTLLLLEHPHVYTIGRRGDASEVLLDEDSLAARGVIVREADRGGRVTYHGPGQLVGYPIVALGPAADLVGYLRQLEEVLIRTLAEYSIDAGRVEGCSGVWCGLSKVAAVGVRVVRGVTKHGFALNVSPDMSMFSGIVPCGILDKGVSSIEQINGTAPDLDEVARRVDVHFREVFGFNGVSQ